MLVQICVTEASSSAAGTLWSALEDLQSWPQWCPVFSAVQPDGPLAVGTTARVVQPGLRAATWTVRTVAGGRSFRWDTRGPGFLITADHLIEPRGPGAMVTLTVAVTGSMGWAVSLISGRSLRSHLVQQARALAARPDPAA